MKLHHSQFDCLVCERCEPEVASHTVPGASRYQVTNLYWATSLRFCGEIYRDLRLRPIQSTIILNHSTRPWLRSLKRFNPRPPTPCPPRVPHRAVRRCFYGAVYSYRCTVPGRQRLFFGLPTNDLLSTDFDLLAQKSSHRLIVHHHHHC